jgi:flagellar motor switch protein FliN
MTTSVQDLQQETTIKNQDSRQQVQSVELPQAAETDYTGPAGSIDILLDMNVPVTVTIGQTEISVRKLLQLGPGAVLPLGKPVDEPMDLYINQARFATADVVVVDGCFGVKIKTIIGVNKEDK